MRLLLIVITFVLSLSCVISDKEYSRHTDNSSPRDLKQYNPEKAGAVIAEYFDITNKIVFPNKYDFLERYGHVKIKSFYDITEFKGIIYIHIEGIIYLFNKKTMQKLTEIAIIFPDFLNINFRSLGLIVTKNNVLLICGDQTKPPYPSYLFSINLSSGKAVLLDWEETFGLQPLFLTNRPMIGYNKQNGLFWLRIEESSASGTKCGFHFFQYDEKTKSFMRKNVEKAPIMVGKKNQTGIWWAFINGNAVWYNGYAGPNTANDIWDVGIDLRSIDDPENSIHFIDVEYLGTLSLPLSIIYDEPYIWIMAERDDQIQMLKLLPNK